MADWIRQLTTSRRLLAVVGLAAALVPIWLLAKWATAPAHVPLLADLSWAEVSEIATRLDAEGIPHEMINGGTAITVPTAKLAAARVLMAREGHGLGRPGLELFDEPVWGMTDFTQRVTYRRALEGELARTIGALRGVNRAQVHLSIPEASPLRRGDQRAEAAVVVGIRTGDLAPAVVTGIAQLVSNAVEHLSPNNVAVLDNTGRLLSAPTDDDPAMGMTNRQLQLQQGVEEHLTGKAAAMVTQVLGPGNARVQISADLDFDRVDRTIEAFNPDGAVIASEARQEVDGAAANGGSQTILQNEFSNSKSVERIIGEVGNIRRMTVAVLLNEAAVNASAAPGQSATQVANLEALVRSTVGFSRARGDQISIAVIPFDTTQTIDVATLAADAEGGSILDVIERFARPVAGIVGLLLTFILAWRVLRPMTGAVPLGALPAPAATAALGTPEAPQQARLREQIVSQTDNLPETAAHVLRAWMAES